MEFLLLFRLSIILTRIPARPQIHSWSTPSSYSAESTSTCVRRPLTLDDPALPIDNNHDEQQIRPWATGQKNWLFAGTLLGGQRAAAITSLIQSAKLNGHDPYAYLKDVLTRLPTHKDRDIEQLLPHIWPPSPSAT